MYNPSSAQKTLDFGLPFSGKLLADNRWVKLANEIPWAKIEEKYARNFTKEGPPAKPLRVALGALIIQTKCNYTDEETVEQIRENPYLQYFIGFTEYTVEKPFDSSLMVHFRKRITAEMLCDINDMMFTSKKESPSDDSDDHDKSSGSSSSGDNKSCNKEEKKHGKLILDATCAPADIRYPTDVSLLNEAREKLEDIIDTLHQPLKGIEKKPRTDRKKARKEYLSIAKLRKWTAKKVRKAVGKQLTYVKRNLKSVDYLLTKVDYNLLSTKQKHDLEVIRKLYSQQQYMYQNKEHRVDNRIVSINQPHVRPIVRGKQKAEVEFGAKVAVSLVDGYAFVDYLNWNNYNESSTLKDAVEKYRERFGYYPEAILADTIYRTRENINYCKQLGIRLSGPKLGRPSTAISKELRKIEYLDSCKRNAIEGKFGEGKRSYGLQRIMARLKETSETVIVMQFFVMNLGRKLRVLFAQFFEALFRRFFMLDLPNFAYINC